MRYTVKYINTANQIINYLHTDSHSEAINTEIKLRDKGYGEVWIADTIEEILVG